MAPDDELEEKFCDQAESVITQADADALLKAVWPLDEAGSPEALSGWIALSGTAG